MSVSKPTVTPTWASGGAITAPSGGKQTTGWIPAERAAAQFFNWLFFNIGLWLTWLGALFTNGGTATGNMDLGLPAEGVTPLMVLRDFKGNIRSTVDHLGLRGGDGFREFKQGWETALAGTTAPAGWTFTPTVAGTATITVPDNTINALNERRLVLTTPAVNNDTITCQGQYKGYLASGAAGSTGFSSGIVMEWAAAAVIITSTHGISQVGITFNSSTHPQYAVFTGGNGQAFWQYQWEDNATGTVTNGNTTVPYSSGILHYFRIEILGNQFTSQVNSNFQINWYIDGVLVHQENNAALSSFAFGEIILNAANSNNAPDVLHVGATKLTAFTLNQGHNI